MFNISILVVYRKQPQTRRNILLARKIRKKAVIGPIKHFLDFLLLKFVFVTTS